MNLYGVIEEARARGCSAVMFGHIHRPVLMEKDGVLAINPGSLTYPRQEGRKPSYAVLDTDINGKMKARIEFLER